MPAYFDVKTKTWYCKFYYENWQCHRKKKMKRGFKLQREAKNWERKFLEQFARNPDISFQSLYKRYKEYITLRIRESTAQSRFNMIDKHTTSKSVLYRTLLQLTLWNGRISRCRKSCQTPI